MKATLARLRVQPAASEVETRLAGIAAALEEWLQTRSPQTNEAASSGMETASSERKEYQTHEQCTTSS